ncbi:hypothetical protein ACLKA7_010791 [Drosophila subpalustris]
MEGLDATSAEATHRQPTAVCVGGQIQTTAPAPPSPTPPRPPTTNTLQSVEPTVCTKSYTGFYGLRNSYIWLHSVGWLRALLLAKSGNGECIFVVCSCWLLRLAPTSTATSAATAQLFFELRRLVRIVQQVSLATATNRTTTSFRQQ